MKKLITLLLSAALILSLCACGSKGGAADNSSDIVSREKINVNVFMLNGPTGIGAAQLMKKAKEGTAADNYNFTVVADPNEIVSKISTGEADIAAVATNLAAKLYNKTEGGVTVIAVNTLGVLNVITNGNTAVSSLADLRVKRYILQVRAQTPSIS